MGNQAMHRGALSDLTTFITVADLLSFRGAGERLGVTPSALSHSMKQLEERLGMRLLNRTTRSVSLTDAGLRLLERLRPAFDQITNAMEDLNEVRGRPVGNLRVYVSSTAAADVVAPIWKCFLSTYPEVNLEVESGEKPIDIVGKGFDAGIGPRNHSAIDMIAVRVTDPRKIAMVATPSYFAQHSPPQTPDDLIHHGCIQYRVSNGRLFEWMFERNGESTTLAARRAAENPRFLGSPDVARSSANDAPDRQSAIGIVHINAMSFIPTSPHEQGRPSPPRHTYSTSTLRSGNSRGPSAYLI
jgi:DNA-binding transcriptional LysR family regulator